jgi:hypothetical protein
MIICCGDCGNCREEPGRVGGVSVVFGVTMRKPRRLGLAGVWAGEHLRSTETMNMEGRFLRARVVIFDRIASFSFFRAICGPTFFISGLLPLKLDHCNRLKLRLRPIIPASCSRPGTLTRKGPTSNITCAENKLGLGFPRIPSPPRWCVSLLVSSAQNAASLPSALCRLTFAVRVARWQSQPTLKSGHVREDFFAPTVHAGTGRALSI